VAVREAGWGWASAYREHTMPCYLVGLYYNWLVVFPLGLPSRLYAHIIDPPYTRWHNLNTVLAGTAWAGAMLIVGGIMVWALVKVSGGGRREAAFFVVGPAAFGLAWYMLGCTVGWLFA
jgi:hypothetical protein